MIFSQADCFVLSSSDVMQISAASHHARCFAKPVFYVYSFFFLGFSVIAHVIGAITFALQNRDVTCNKSYAEIRVIPTTKR